MAKLPKGMAPYKDGLLRYRFTLNGERYAVYGVTAKECQAKRDEIRDKIAKGLLTDRRELTLNGYYDEWQKRRDGQIKPSTRYANDRHYKSIKQSLGNRKLSSITRRDVYKLQETLNETLTSKGVNDTISLLRSVLESAVNDRLIPYNPTAGIRALKRTEEEAESNIHRLLTSEEIEAFFEAGKASHYFNLYRFLLMTGARCGEACALTWGDVDSDQEVIHINKTVTRISDKETVIGPPKTLGSKRDIELSPEIKTILRDQRIMQEGLFGFRAVTKESQIFTTQGGKLICPSNTAPTIAYICRKATKAGHPIERFTAHAFRHTFVSNQIAKGETLAAIAEEIGHTNSITLQKYYSHADQDQVKEAFRSYSAEMGKLIKIS